MDIHIPLLTLRETIAFISGLLIGSLLTFLIIDWRKTGRQRSIETLEKMKLDKLKKLKLP